MTTDIDRAATPRGIRPPEPIPPSNTGGYNDGLLSFLGLSTAQTKVSVSERSVSGLVAVQAGIDMIAHGVAAMMDEAQVFNAAGEEIDRPPIVDRPTPLLGSFEFWCQLVDTLMKRGNDIGIRADYDLDGYPRQVVPAHPDAVSLDDSTGFPWYTVGVGRFSWEEVVHVRHGAPRGSFWGRGIVERYRTTVERHLHEGEYGRSAFASAGVPPGIIKLNDRPTVDQDEAEAVQGRWVERNTSTRRPAVFGTAMDFTPISWNPQDAQFIESRQLSVAESALMCGLDPADLGAAIGGSSITYANLTDRQLARVLNSLMPWVRLIEGAWSDLLPGSTIVRGNPEALLRSSTKERMESYEIGHALGIYTTPELRDIERRPKIADEEWTLERPGTDPDPDPDPPAPPEPAPDLDEEPTDD